MINSPRPPTLMTMGVVHEPPGPPANPPPRPPNPPARGAEAPSAPPRPGPPGPGPPPGPPGPPKFGRGSALLSPSRSFSSSSVPLLSESHSENHFSKVPFNSARVIVPSLKGTFEKWFSEWDSDRSEEHTTELQSPDKLLCRLLLEKNSILAVI